MFVLALTVLQAADVGTAMQTLNRIQRGTEVVLERTMACMDEQVKAQLKSDPVAATPASIADGALAACKHLKQEYVAAVTSPDSPISAATARQMSDDSFQKFRETYLEHIDKMLAKPEVAKVRTTIALADWRKCVVGKATEWSRLSDEAATVGEAAVTECEFMWPKVEAVLAYDLRSQGLPSSAASTSSEKLHDAMRKVAVAAVVAERAKRLPHRR